MNAVGIDERQLYEDLVKYFAPWANAGKIINVAALI